MLVRCGLVGAAMTLTGCDSDPPTHAGAASPDALLEQLAAAPEVRQYNQLEQMFPPEVMDELRATPLPVSPTDGERLAMAAAGA